ncbi:MAG: hypothetical protein HY350_02615, partial [Candidatus Omnitrophica bacterium]|nr:hypothetical protein [Candidatus Omnitrophota bacterium]
MSDSRGNILCLNKGPASSYVGVGENRLKTSLGETIRGLLAKLSSSPGRVDIIYAGISGINKTTPREVKNRVKKELEKITAAKKIIFDDDCDLGVAFASGLDCNEKLSRIVVLAGTGIGIMGVNRQGRISRLHGWGPLMGEEGSGYYIGMKILESVARAVDGRGKDTILRKLILQAPRFKNCKYSRGLVSKNALFLSDKQRINIWGEITAAVYYCPSPRMDRNEIAALSKYAYVAAEKGDDISVAILKSAGEELGLAVNVVAKRLGILGRRFQVVPAGGVFKAGRFVLKPLEDTILSRSPGAEILYPVSFP